MSEPERPTHVIDQRTRCCGTHVIRRILVGVAPLSEDELLEIEFVTEDGGRHSLTRSTRDRPCRRDFSRSSTAVRARVRFDEAVG